MAGTPFHPTLTASAFLLILERALGDDVLHIHTDYVLNNSLSPDTAAPRGSEARRRTRSKTPTMTSTETATSAMCGRLATSNMRFGSPTKPA